MLDCHGCLSRCLRAITAPVNTRAPSSLSSTRTSVLHCGPFLASSNPAWPQCNRILTPSSLSLLQCRSFHNSPYRAAKRPKRTTFNYEADPQLIETTLKSNKWSRHEQDILTRASDRRPLTGAEARRLGKLQLHARAREIKDPYDLLEFVKASIASKTPLDRVETVMRKVSYQCNTVVSWNYYIAHIFSKAPEVRGAMGDAGRAFTMMKKCAIEPDSHTYMALLVGLLRVAAEGSGTGQAAAKRAASIYHGLSLPHAKVKVTTMLMNAALNVCARAGEMDMIWAIAAKMPETGEAAPDHITYSIILNAMRNNIQKQTSTPANVSERTVMDAKGIWAEIISKHSAKELAIDASLVGAMGRLLLIGKNKKDWDNVFALLEQTMDIPRIFPAADAETPLVHERPRIGTFGAEPRRKKQGDVVKDPFEDIFKPLDSKKKELPVSPSTNTLSLALETCNKLANRAGADGYWKLFTDPRGYGLTPDVDNIHVMLRLYKEEGDSRASLDMLHNFFTDNSDSGATGVTFRIALGSCKQRVRSKGNSFADATAIVDLMLQHIPVPDYRTLVWYSELALQQKTPATFPLAIERLTKGMHAIEKGNKQVGFITKSDGLEAPVTEKVNDGQTLLLALIKMIDISSARHQRDPETVRAWRELRTEAQDNLHDILHDDEEHVQLFGDSVEHKGLAGVALHKKRKELANDRRRHQENVRSLAPILDTPFGNPYQTRRRSWKFEPSYLRKSRVVPEEVVGVGRASTVKPEERQESTRWFNPAIRERRPATSESDPPASRLGTGARSIRNITGANSALEAAARYAREKARGPTQ